MKKDSEQDASRYGQNMLLHHQAGQQEKAPLCMVLTEFEGIPDQLLTAKHHLTMGLHPRTGTISFFVEMAYGFISAEGDISLSVDCN